MNSFFTKIKGSTKKKVFLWISSAAFFCLLTQKSFFSVLTTCVTLFIVGVLLFFCIDTTNYAKEMSIKKSLFYYFAAIILGVGAGYLFNKSWYDSPALYRIAKIIPTISPKYLIYIIIFTGIFCSIPFTSFAIKRIVSLFENGSSFNRSIYKKSVGFIKSKFAEFKITIIFTFVAAVLCYGFMFTNVLPNHDDVFYFTSLGESLSSGRWGLEILNNILSPLPIPWVLGLASVVFQIINICIIIDIFEIRDPVLQCILGGAIISFPSQIGIFSFMFTSLIYAVSFFCAVFSVWIIKNRKIIYWLLSVMLLVISLSIYQAYISLSASFLIILLILQIIKDHIETKIVFKKAVLYFLILVFSVAIYYAITVIIMRITGTSFNDYAQNSINNNLSILDRIIEAYKYFFKIFLNKEFGLISSSISQILHFILFFVSALCCYKYYSASNEIKSNLFLTLLLIILPLSIMSIYLISSAEGIHTLVLYSFISFYILVIVLYQGIGIYYFKEQSKNLIAILFTIMIISNVYIANSCYFRLHFLYENAYSFYTSITTQIFETEGFDDESKIAFVGNFDETHDFQYYNLPYYDILGIDFTFIKDYARPEFIERFVGRNLNYASEEEIEKLENDPQVREMPSYPYYGSIKEIGDYIVVKLGDTVQQ